MFDLLKPYMTRMAAVQGTETPLVRWGVLVIVLVLLWSIVFTPYLEWRDQRIELLTSRLSKVERLFSLQYAADVWNDAEVAHKKAGEALAALFFQGSSYAVVQADLLNMLRKKYAQHNLVLESQHLLESEPKPGIGESIGLNLNLNGKMADVLAFVDDLAALDKILVVNGLYIGTFTKTKARLQLKVSGFRMQQSGADE